MGHHYTIDTNSQQDFTTASTVAQSTWHHHHSTHTINIHLTSPISHLDRSHGWDVHPCSILYHIYPYFIGAAEKRQHIAQRKHHMEVGTRSPEQNYWVVPRSFALRPVVQLATRKCLYLGNVWKCLVSCSKASASPGRGSAHMHLSVFFSWPIKQSELWGDSSTVPRVPKANTFGINCSVQNVKNSWHHRLPHAARHPQSSCPGFCSIWDFFKK